MYALSQLSLAASSPADHSLSGVMQVIWAHGQDQGDYSHRPLSGLERGNPSILDFYRDDELKYHGRDNRGTDFIDFSGKFLALRAHL